MGILFAIIHLPGLSNTQTSSNELQFEALTISAEQSDPKTKTFTTPGAVSILGQETQLRQLDSVIRALPGTYTNINPTQGTVSVNIRGFSGFGRVNSMIDGVPQTFYGTSANSASRYHAEDETGYGPSSSFGAMIDANFLTGIEINRSLGHGARSVNALSGSSNLRTIGIDDVIFDGNRIGVLSKFSHGSNGIGQSGMIALGAQHYFNDDHRLGAFFAYSGSNMKANYKRGDGHYAAEKGFVRRLDQRPISWLSKIEWQAESHQLLLNARDYQNNVGGRQTHNRHYSLSYHYHPLSPWVNLQWLIAQNQSHQHYHDDANIWLLSKAKTQNQATYIDLNNTSTWQGKAVSLSFNYGVNLLKNSYHKQATGINQDNETYTPFAPQGDQQLRSGYVSSTLDYRSWTLDAGISYTQSNMSGYKPACEVITKDNTVIPSNCFPSYAAEVNIHSRLSSGSIGVAYKAQGGFSPFIRYAQSSRVPNLQEIFFSNEGAGSMNPYLKPEHAKTLELGFNVYRHDMFTENDRLGVKLVGYQRRLQDYIYSQSFYMGSRGITPHLGNDVSADFHAQVYTNAIDKITHKGIELDLDYDAGIAFANLAYSYQKSDLPADVTATTGTGFGTTSVTTQPKHVATLTLGGRLFNQTLTLGSSFKYTGKSKRYFPNGLEVDESELLQDLPNMPIIVDLFGHYRLNKHVLLKFSVQNLTDRNYVDALNSLNSTTSQHDVDNSGNHYTYSFSNAARGRTYLLGAEIRF